MIFEIRGQRGREKGRRRGRGRGRGRGVEAPEYLKSKVIEKFMGLDRIRFRELVEGSLEKVFIVFRAL